MGLITRKSTNTSYTNLAVLLEGLSDLTRPHRIPPRPGARCRPHPQAPCILALQSRHRRLMIINEIHLLHDERSPVLEGIVEDGADRRLRL
ncbi:hypothetical protein L210DRAFT_3549449, partial [Boletus edulis BED1]